MSVIMILICSYKHLLWYLGQLTAVLLAVEGLIFVWYVDKNACLIEWKVSVHPWYYNNVAIVQPSILIIRYYYVSIMIKMEIMRMLSFPNIDQVKIYRRCLDDFD